MSPAPTLNGQIIGQTERATRALLDRLLAETDTSFDTWVTLKFVGDNGDVPADALVRAGNPTKVAVDLLLEFERALSKHRNEVARLSRWTFPALGGWS